MSRAPFGLYIHIPFCARKCGYCDFYSVPADDARMGAYLTAVCDDLARWSHTLGGRQADTLYLGGGTPILFGADRLSRLLERCCSLFGLTDAEITLEANPNHTDYETLCALRRAGFNRISFGVQSAVDAELVALTRSHTAAQAGDAIRWAQQAGFTNISADLMLGIAHQTTDSLTESIRFLAGLDVQHISAYLLKVEEGTPFAAQRQSLALPDEDLTAALYLHAVQTLASHGYTQYEISNFARDGMVCKHNLLYWDTREYLGLGPAAHSFIGGKRLAYPNDLARYLAGGQAEQIDEGGDLEEYLMLRLRLSDGLVFSDTRARYPAGLDEAALTKRAQPLLRQGLCIADAMGIRLTPRGFLFSNHCIATLLF